MQVVEKTICNMLIVIPILIADIHIKYSGVLVMKVKISIVKRITEHSL